MAIQSKEFVGIAEGIKSHELSTKGKIESLRGAISELSGQRMSLGNRISYLEAALAAAYEDTDEDGDPDYGRISAIEAQISVAESELSAVEGQLDVAHGELSHSEAELESVMEEKAQTLFEIQERARKTSSNIAVAGGMYGAYSGVGSSLQSSMQTSLASLSQAASILDGSVDGFAGGGAGGVSGGSSGASRGSISTSALNAFTAPANGDTAHSHSSGNFSTSQTSTVTPAAKSGFYSSQQSGSTQKTSNFHSKQNGNSYATAAFSGKIDDVPITPVANYQSSQTSSNAGTRFLNDNKDSSEGGSSQTPSNTKTPQASDGKAPTSASNMFSDLRQLTMSPEEIIQYDSQHSIANSSAQKPTDGIERVRELGESDLRWEDISGAASNSISSSPKARRELANDLDYELSIGTLLSKLNKKQSHTTPNIPSSKPQSSADKGREFLQRLQVDVKPIPNYTTSASNSASDDDIPNIGARIRQHDDWLSDREQNILTKFGLSNTIQSPFQNSTSIQRDINNIKAKFSSFLQKKSSGTKSNATAVANAQKIVDNYCKRALNNVLSETKQAVRLTDSVEFQDDEKFALGLGGPTRAAGVNGYNDGKKSYVKNSGPHPQKTAIHEHNHQLSCNDIKDKFGYITEYRRGISINGNDRQVNEALTEYFTKKMMGSEYPANPNVGYKDNMLRVEKMEAGFGEQTLKEAYYQNKPQLLKAKYEAIMGEGSWESFSQAFDESLRKYTPQEEYAIREHYLQTGTRLMTQTDIIRQKATDYANRCATLFSIKSKGVK